MISTPKLMLRATASSVFALLLAAGCATGPGPDIFGGDQPADPGPAKNVVGIVQDVDTSRQEIVVDTRPEGHQSPEDRVVLFYDSRTRVEYEGETYEPSALEVGDEIRAMVDVRGERLWVDSIDVLYDSSVAGDVSTAPLRGIVRHVDTRNAFVEIERDGDGELLVVHYEPNIQVRDQDRRFSPDDLQRGDLVAIETRQQGRDLRADEFLLLERSSEVAAQGTFAADLEGTVAYVDTSRRVIGLERPQFAQGFDASPGAQAELRYDDSTIVMFEGQRYQPTNLEPGDQISVDVRDVERGLIAQEIRVDVDVNKQTSQR